ncbi:hypothetical protein [Phocaeicola fibrisolvens]|uniref:hypothetical protein n=1 Tax=Phocaeicola fibrisolvens TaxID=2981793 RepID=UPI0011DD66F4|nr:hypothetical protein [Phocaeicola fibrisolvens]MCU6778251.1 hypothetical protein [Phocaeicola fibrisolvens]
MKKSLLIISLCAFIFSCSKDLPENQSTQNSTKLIGKTFSTQSLSLTFTSSDSVSFQTKNTLYLLKGKSKYEMNNDTIVIKSPYGKRLKPNETTDSYILNFIGYLRNDRIEATFFIIGPEEKEQYLGHDVTLFME